MTRKDFVLIARVLKDLRDSSGLPVVDIDTACMAFADALRDTNANFDRSRFLKACR